MQLTIRPETPSDYDVIFQLVKAAFKTAPFADGDEQNIVTRLRTGVAYLPELSLVAEIHGQLVGHVLFTNAMIGIHEALVLAPLAVLPAFHGKGVGSALVKEGHALARRMGYTVCTVVGDPAYYARFGYENARKHNITAPFNVPAENLMVVFFTDQASQDVQGEIQYAKEFFENN